MRYFSEREGNELPRGSEIIDEAVWRGVRALIRARVEDGSFGASYQEKCFEYPMAVGTDDAAFRDAILARIPGLPLWPWVDNAYSAEITKIPSTIKILDMIEFCWTCIGEPIQQGFHEFGSHYHLVYDKDAGRKQFRSEIEDIFRRNGIAYELTEGGRVERLVPQVFGSTLAQPRSGTRDLELDRLLETAHRKFLNPRPAIRQEALEALWDAWERLKTLDGQGDKKSRAAAMLDKTAGTSSPMFRNALEREAFELTAIGNSLRIRHSETSQELLAKSDHADYLFYRLFSLIQLILRSR